VIVATHAVLVLAAVGFTYRLCIGPLLTDRAIALNGLLLVGMGANAAQTLDTENGAFLPTLVVIALVGPISTAMLARFIERGQRDG
jgi:multisubunit Na+/H+ antiporter MnhF subunit